MFHVHQVDKLFSTCSLQYFKREFSCFVVPYGETTISLRMSGCPFASEGVIKLGGDMIARITRGWQQFVYRYGLREGDVCAFRLRTHMEGICVVVHIIDSSA